MPEEKKTSVRPYDKHVNFKFNKHTDADIIEKLDNQKYRQAYIKKLIRDDIARNGSGPADL